MISVHFSCLAAVGRTSELEGAHGIHASPCSPRQVDWASLSVSMWQDPGLDPSLQPPHGCLWSPPSAESRVIRTGLAPAVSIPQLTRYTQVEAWPGLACVKRLSASLRPHLYPHPSD